MKITPTQIEAVYKLIPDKAKADRMIMLAKRNGTMDFANMLQDALYNDEQEKGLIDEFLDVALKQDENMNWVNAGLYDAALGHKDLEGNDICPECGKSVPSGFVDYRYDVGRRMCPQCYDKVVQESKKKMAASMSNMDRLTNLSNIAKTITANDLGRHYV